MKSVASKMRWTATVALVVTVSTAAGRCGSASSDVTRDGSVGEDVGTLDYWSVETNPLPEVFVEGIPDTGVMDLAAEASEDLPGPACEPGEGCFLDPCNENSQCISGWCVEDKGEGVCSKECQDECPAGWSCKQVAGTEPDVVFICVSGFANLCKPCTNGADCKSAGGADDVCVDYGDDGDFCGGACAAGKSCPWGFSCKEAKTVDGASVEQCVSDTGSCPCTARSVALAASTRCAATNEAGSCSGKRTCTEDGLSPCDAAVPAPEACNGTDDDCDGETDEPFLVRGKYVELCDDGNACTADLCMAEGGCVNDVVDGGECSDANPCTVADHCAAGTCVGDPVQCDDQNSCTDNVCTETGGCSYPSLVGPCDDGDPCTLADQCAAGQCAGTPVSCDCLSDADCAPLEDGNLCNGTLWCDTSALPYRCAVDPTTVVQCPQPAGVDAVCLGAHCDPADGQCSFVPQHEGMACKDENACDINDHCAGGECAGGPALNCNDGNGCTDDACDPASGCVHTMNQAACSDGNPCTVGDACSGGECAPGAPLDCDDQDPCNGVEACDPAKGCTTGVPLQCDDADPCNGIETCAPLVGCVSAPGPDCADGNPCTDDVCAPGVGCKHIANASGCDDGNACTVGDVCKAGVCAPGAAVDCDDGNVCTTDKCLPASGCTYTLNSAACDDGSACTAGDQCASGVCNPGKLIGCNDGNPCTKDSCDPEIGCVQEPLSGIPCSDGDPCSVGDTCTDGQCAPGAPLPCDDFNPCTDDDCVAGTGCAHTPNQAPCDDGLPCTIDDTCAGGWCSGKKLLSCDDGNACTEDSCSWQEGGCVHVAVGCDDGNVCTADSCDPAAGCVHEPVAAPCDDGDACTVGDTCAGGQCQPGAPTSMCDDGNPCTDDSCLPPGACANVPNTAACDDGNPCNGQDVCGGGACLPGPGPSCDDLDPCTDDGCQGGKCTHTANLQAAGCSDWQYGSGLSCLTGYPPSMDENGTLWAVGTATPCDQGDAYNNDRIVGVDSLTGKQVALFTIGSPASQPVYRQQRVTLSLDWNWNQTCGGCQIGYNLPGGGIAWQGGQGPHPRGGISMSADGTMYSSYGSILAIGWNGSTVWSAPGNGGSQGTGSWIMGDGGVVGCANGGTCRKVSAGGSSLWQQALGCNGPQLATDSASRVVASCWETGVWVFPAGGGGAAWNVDPAPNVSAPLVATQDRVVVGTSTGHVLVISSGGAVLGDHTLCQGAQFTPWMITGGDRVWGVCANATVAAVGLDGSSLYTLSTGKNANWVSLALDGQLLVSVGASVYRMKVGSLTLASSPWPTVDHDLQRTRNGKL